MVSGQRGVRAALTPALAGVTVSAAFELVDRACDDWEDGWLIPDVKTVRGAIHIVLRGTFPRECAAATAVNVLDRALFADRLFRAECGRRRGKFRRPTREDATPAGTRPLDQHPPRPL